MVDFTHIIEFLLRERLILYEVKRGKELPELPGRTADSDIDPRRLPHPGLRRHRIFDIISTAEDLARLPKTRWQVFTDGSRLDGRVGAAASFWKEETEKRYATIKLSNFCSVFQAELAAIKQALQLILHKHKSYEEVTLLSDSRSALQTICDPTSLHPLAAEVREHLATLESKGIKIDFAWIKAHQGLCGNERADELAKKAALTSKKSPAYDKFPISYAKRLIREATVREWQKRYADYNPNSPIKMFFNSVQAAHRVFKNYEHCNIGTQLFTGHGGIRSYLHKYRLAVNPSCLCDNITHETIEHILIDCPRYGRQRHDYEKKMAQPITKNNIATIMEKEKLRAIFLDYGLKIMRKAAKANGSTVA
ncbi:uncharacterized protein LOC123722558 [Papilio machaon]|uniref:uncharacterized protein LOC123722558 n=1 Tax=Papilio machaon TaxID=76193 RepID=UPI001E665574|nr:uncharacterized protein LOC123722558 [Papilio machaon]